MINPEEVCMWIVPVVVSVAVMFLFLASQTTGKKEKLYLDVFFILVAAAALLPISTYVFHMPTTKEHVGYICACAMMAVVIMYGRFVMREEDEGDE